jgi:membrane protein implicated in regulation of membrane protease activity
MRIAGLVLAVVIAAVAAYAVYASFLVGGIVFLSTMVGTVIALAIAAMVFGKRRERSKRENEESAALAKMRSQREGASWMDDDAAEVGEVVREGPDSPPERE